MIVMKFGGTSVQDSSAINNLVEIVKSRLLKKPVIVCSAISGMTDTLFNLCINAGNGNTERSGHLIESIRKRHIQIVVESFSNNTDRQNSLKKVNDLIKKLSDLVNGIQLVNELSDRSVAKIFSFGEILSTVIVADILNYNNVMAQWIDAREFIKTKGDIRDAEPEYELIKAKTPLFLNPVLEKESIAVIQGFIGSNSDGDTTVFSRGGSDFSASLIAMAMNAEEVEIWTDTNGILTGDPKNIMNPLTVKEISYTEASELASFGAKVLHPSTILPVIENNIPVRILNSFNPKFSGTVISSIKNVSKSPVKSITCKRYITVLNISNLKLPGANVFYKRIFEVLDNHQTTVDLMTTSNYNASITIDDNKNLKNIITELSLFSDIKVETDKSQVCLVGSNIKNIKGIEAQIFNALRGFNISMISQGASLINFSFVVEKAVLDQVMQSLHKKFFED